MTKANLLLLIGYIAALICGGCADREPPSQAPQAATPAKPSPWRTQETGAVIGVPGESADTELAAAIAQARASADDARTRWASATPEDRQRWSVKWAAPTNENSVEHVWVRPLNWSPFRIEGTLESEPVAELEGGKRLGETVSFPIEELSDWIYFAGSDHQLNGSYEGGFTVRVLESRYGQPQ